MSLRPYCTKSVFCRSINSFYVIYSRHVQARHKSVFITSDAVDEFTTQLLQKKTSKWDAAKERAKNAPVRDCKLIQSCDIYNIYNMTSVELDNVFHAALEDNNNGHLSVLIDECTRHKRTPSTNILINLLSYFSSIGNREFLDRIINLCEIVNPEMLANNSNFAHYIAEAISVNGDTNSAIALFEKVYVENTFLRRRIRLMLKRVIHEIVNNKSEAAIIALLKFVEHLNQVHKDVFPLACMWEACFLSEWFAEQMLALDMLRKYPHLFRVITGRIHFVVLMSLKKQQYDVVLRLLEYLMEHKLETQYSIVLVAMFEYNYKRRYLKTCIDIVNWSKKYNISLPSSLENKYLNLILNQMKSDSVRTPVEKPVNEFKF